MIAYLTQGLLFADKDEALIYSKSVDLIHPVDVRDYSQCLKTMVDLERDEETIKLFLYFEDGGLTNENEVIDFSGLEPLEIGIETSERPEFLEGDTDQYNVEHGGSYEYVFTGYDSHVDPKEFSKDLRERIEEARDRIIDNLNEV